jgi:hypothetical protein
MRIKNRVFAFRPVIAFAAVLLLGAPAFASVTDFEFGGADLSPNRTQVELTGSAVCDNTNTDSSTGTATIYQVHGRLLNMGFGIITFDCVNGTWLATVDAIEGLKFQPGPATLVIEASNTGVTTTALPSKGARIKLQ